MKQIEIMQFSPCSDAVKFRAKYKTFKAAWKECPRGDWMLWLAKKVGVDLQTLTLAKALCAKTVLHLMKDERSINAVNVAEKFGRGECTREELNTAAAAAAAAAYTYVAYAYVAYAAAAAAAAAYTYVAAAYADDADDADAAADAADDAAYAYAYVAAYADAADAAANAAARKKNQMETANICREILTVAVFEKLNIKTKAVTK